MRALVAESDLDADVEVESAGTGGWHVGDPPDPRSVAAAADRGVDLEGEARQVSPEDFERFDLLVAMDRSNLDGLLRLAPDEEARAKVRLLRELGEGIHEDVPDPYYGGKQGFAEVVEIIDRNCRALIGQLE